MTLADEYTKLQLYKEMSFIEFLNRHITPEQRVARIKVHVYHDLIWEVIGPDYDYVYRLWSAWCALRYKRNERLGSATISRR